MAPPTPTGIRAPRRRRRGSGRFLGTAAVLVLAGVAAVPIYRRLPWSARSQTPAAPAPAGRRSHPVAAPPPAAPARRRSGRRAGARRRPRWNSCWRADWGSSSRAALDDGLRRMRAAGATADADKLAARAKAALVKVAEAELDRGELEAGVEHYQAAAQAGARGIGHGVAAGGDLACARWRRWSSVRTPTRRCSWRAQGLAVAGDQAPARTRCWPTCCTPRTSTRSR